MIKIGLGEHISKCFIQGEELEPSKGQWEEVIEVAQLVRGLLCKHKDLSLHPQKKPHSKTRPNIETQPCIVVCIHPESVDHEKTALRA